MVLPTSVAISKVVDRNVYRSLVHEPHCSLLRIYLDALRQHDAGTLAQREAIRSALRLELLSKDQYTHADRFLGNLQKIGFDPGGTDHARSRHLLNFLAPGNREQREQILFGWRKKNPAHPVKRPRRQRVEIGKMNRLSISPAMNVALLPIGIVNHVASAFAVGEISRGEAWDEATQGIGLTAVVGASLAGIAGTLDVVDKFFRNKKFVQMLRRANRFLPASLRPFVLPGALMGGFTYLALRGSQEVSPEDQPKYRRYALQELFESFLVSEVGWGVTYGGLQGLFTLFGWSPAGMTLKLGIYGLSALAGGFLMGYVSGKRRQQFRREIKADAFREVLFSLEQLPSKQKYWRAREFEKIDKKLATIINIAALEQPTVSAAVKQAATKTGYNYSYPAVIDFNTVEGWTRNMLMKQSTPTVPVILLQSQQKRLEGLWERGLSDAMHFATNPQPLVIQRDALGLIDPNQFENWGISHAMALLSQYLKMREELH